MSRTGIQQTLINHVYKRNLRLVNTRYRNFVTYITKKKKIKVYWYYDQAIYKIKHFLSQHEFFDYFTYFNKETLESKAVLEYYDGFGLSIHEDKLTEEVYILDNGKILNVSGSVKPLTDIVLEQTNIYVKVQKILEFFHKVIYVYNCL
jgi:hypothetical protein